MNATADDIKVFGYGSLVNRGTRRLVPHSGPVRLRGWRRSWNHCVKTEHGTVCALTIAPDRDADVTGVLVADSRERLPELDTREIGYQRIRLSPADMALDTQGVTDSVDVFTYISTSEASRRGSRDFPIWRSYLECVLAGFLDLGGPAAAREFILTTEGWGVPMLDDRLAPKYMRPTALAPQTREVVEAMIQEHGLDRAQFVDRQQLVISESPASEEFG